MRYLVSLLIALASCGVTPCYAADATVVDVSTTALNKLKGALGGSSTANIASITAAVTTTVTGNTVGQNVSRMREDSAATRATITSTATGLQRIARNGDEANAALTSTATGLPRISRDLDDMKLAITTTTTAGLDQTAEQTRALLQAAITSTVTAGSIGQTQEMIRAILQATLTETSTGIGKTQEQIRAQVAWSATLLSALSGQGTNTVFGPTAAAFKLPLNYAFGILTTTVSCYSSLPVWVGGKRFSLSAKQAGPLVGGTAYIMACNAAVCPATNDPTSWRCISYPRWILAQPLGGADGQKDNNMQDYGPATWVWVVTEGSGFPSNTTINLSAGQ
jgi:hypothetical protein